MRKGTFLSFKSKALLLAAEAAQLAEQLPQRAAIEVKVAHLPDLLKKICLARTGLL